VEGIYLFDPTTAASESNGPSRSCSGHTTDELLGMIIYDFIAHERQDIDRARATTGKDGATRASVSTAGRTDRCGRRGERDRGPLRRRGVLRGITSPNARPGGSLARRGRWRRRRIARLGSWGVDVKTGEFLVRDLPYLRLRTEEFAPNLHKLMEVVHPTTGAIEKNMTAPFTR